MAKQSRPSRPLWHDRFTRPEVEDLLLAVARDNRAHLVKLRAALNGIEELTETLEWSGLPWRWALVYRLAGDSEPIAYVVPNPEVPSAVLCVTHEEARGLPVRKLSRYIREGLASARLVAGKSWPEWSVQAASNVADLQQLFRLLRESRSPTAT